MEKNVILRIDDIGRKNYHIIIPHMLKEMTKREMPYVLGVIACELEEGNNYVISLKKISNKTEFALHGYYHKKDINGNPEFKELSKENASKLIKAGKKIMQEKLAITPTTFIPPWNAISPGTKETLIEEGFAVLSGGKDEFEKYDLLSLGYNTATATFQPHQLVALDRIKRDCEKSFENRGYCVIMIHPQDYLIDDIDDKHKPDIDFVKYEQFISLLDYLECTNVNFMTFSALLKKKNNI